MIMDGGGADILSVPVLLDHSNLRPTVWVPAVIALLVVVIGPYLNYKAQEKLTGKQKRQEAYSILMGQKLVITQLYVSRSEAYIFSDYHERKSQLAGTGVESLDFQEAQRWMHKSEDLVLEIAKSRQNLFETLGLIGSYFSSSDKLKELSRQIYNSKGLEIKIRPFDKSAEDLEAWKVKSVNEVQELVEKEYTKLIDELVNYLNREIDKEAG